MKNLVFGLFILGSFSAFAEDQTSCRDSVRTLRKEIKAIEKLNNQSSNAIYVLADHIMDTARKTRDVQNSGGKLTESIFQALISSGEVAISLGETARNSGIVLIDRISNKLDELEDCLDR